MAFLKLTTEAEATGALKRLYDAALSRAGYVANIIKVMSRDAATAEASIQFYIRLMKSENALSRARKEMLATVVSNINDCYYWTLSHAEDFRAESGQHEIAEQLIYDFRSASLSAEDRALCEFAAKLTLRPGAMEKQDVHLLCQQGFTHEQITIAVQVIGYFNYINRVAEGLGVDPEDWMKPAASEWRQRKAKDY